MHDTRHPRRSQQKTPVAVLKCLSDKTLREFNPAPDPDPRRTTKGAPAQRNPPTARSIQDRLPDSRDLAGGQFRRRRRRPLRLPRLCHRLRCRWLRPGTRRDGGGFLQELDPHRPLFTGGPPAGSNHPAPALGRAAVGVGQLPHHVRPGLEPRVGQKRHPRFRQIPRKHGKRTTGHPVDDGQHLEANANARPGMPSSINATLAFGTHVRSHQLELLRRERHGLQEHRSETAGTRTVSPPHRRPPAGLRCRMRHPIFFNLTDRSTRDIVD